MSKTYIESRFLKPLEELFPVKGDLQDDVKVLLEGLDEPDDAGEYISNLLLDKDEEVPVGRTHLTMFCTQFHSAVEFHWRFPFVSSESYCPRWFPKTIFLVWRPPLIIIMGFATHFIRPNALHFAYGREVKRH